MDFSYKVRSGAEDSLSQMSTDADMSQDSGLGSDVQSDDSFTFSDILGLEIQSPKARSSPVETQLWTVSARPDTSFDTPVGRALSFDTSKSEEDYILKDLSFDATSSSSYDPSFVMGLNGLKLSPSPTPVSSPLVRRRIRKSLFESAEDSSFMQRKEKFASKRKHASQFSRSKRCRVSMDLMDSTVSKIENEAPGLENEAHIKSVLVHCADKDNLTGDFSTQCTLPCVTGKHQDLKYVTPQTVGQLLNGKYDKSVEYKIIDCRYPYEYEGGHIENAENLYTKDEIKSEFLSELKQARNPQKRLVLIFHCEFSSERGPKLARFLRNQDREMNKDSYPNLHYPEVYVMEGGYKNFFGQCLEKCVPQTYLPMLQKEYSDDLKFYRSKAKSCDRRKSRKGFSRCLALEL